MIAKLTGLVDSLGEGWVVIDVGGVGYLVLGSGSTLDRLATGEMATLEIETHVREDHIHLYGFTDAVERDWFRILMTVQGVGSKVALAILTVLTPDQLMPAIAAGDRAALTQATGVGSKLAVRILSELKDKVGDIALGPAAVAGDAAGVTATDAVSALVNLGYGASESYAAVAHAAGRLGSAADVEALIRAGLAELAPKEHSP